MTTEGTRAGHDISIEVTLDAGLPIGNLWSKTHEIETTWLARERATVRLRDQAAIPNKDFLLRYDCAGRNIQTALLAHRSSTGGFFTLILQPPERVTAADVSPKELIFVLDTSGSMSGFPIEKAKEAMRLALDGLYPQDTFNLITFSGDTEILFPEPVAASPENLRMAQMFLQSRAGGGGTEMMKAIRAALETSGSQGRLRIVCFMTDGFVGNDMQILAEVQKHPEARVFAFGIGQSVNRYLLDGMARYGHGEVDYVGLKDDGSAAARRFHERVRNPLMTSLSIDWGTLPVTDVYPKEIPDLFDAKPVVLAGRYSTPARGVVRLRGVSGREVVRELEVVLPDEEKRHDAQVTLWARRHVADLLSQDLAGAQAGSMRADLQEQITQIGLDFQLMTQFTSFVAVEERIVTSDGKPRRIEVPVEIPEGVSYEGVFGRSGPNRVSVGGNPGAVIGGIAGGFSGGVIGGITGSVPLAAPPPPPEVKSAAKVVAAIPRQFDTGRLMIAKSGARRAGPQPQKLDPALLTMLEAHDKTATVDVQILLQEVSGASLDALREFGVEILLAPGSDLLLVGRVALGKLEDLAKLQVVRYIVLRTTDTR